MRTRTITTRDSRHPIATPREVGIELDKAREFEYILPAVRGYLWSLLAQIEAEGDEALERNEDYCYQLADRIEEVQEFEAAAKDGLLSQEPSFMLTPDEARHAGDFMGIHDIRLPLHVGETLIALEVELISLAGPFTAHEDTRNLEHEDPAPTEIMATVA